MGEYGYFLELHNVDLGDCTANSMEGHWKILGRWWGGGGVEHKSKTFHGESMGISDLEPHIHGIKFNFA